MNGTSCIALSVLLVSVAVAQKTPISESYVDDVLRARSVAVVANSESEPVQDLQENERARLDVTTALTKWGKYQVTRDTSVADLIIVVRKGRARAATIDDNKTANPGVVLYPSDSGITVGVGSGQKRTRNQTDPTREAHPRLGTEIGSADDLLEVYLGRTPRVDDASRKATQYPLEKPAIWFYTATDALKAPRVEAVAKFREAVEAAEKKSRELCFWTTIAVALTAVASVALLSSAPIAAPAHTLLRIAAAFLFLHRHLPATARVPVRWGRAWLLAEMR